MKRERGTLRGETVLAVETDSGSAGISRRTVTAPPVRGAKGGAGRVRHLAAMPYPRRFFDASRAGEIL
jgi:hypothetical protein